MNDPVLLVVLAVAALAALFIAKKSRSKKTPKASNGTPEWRIGPTIDGKNSSPGMASTPTLTTTGWWFDFPTDPNSHVHYVQWFNPPKLIEGQTLTIRFRVSGSGFVPQEFPTNPALVSLMLQRRGDNWGAQGVYEGYRQFSKATIVLNAGEFTLSVPLKNDQWGGVYGGQSQAIFSAVLADIDNIAVLFGSAGGRGHGVFSTEPSRFELLDISVK